MHRNIRLILVLTFALCAESAYSQLCFPVKKIHAFFEPVRKGVISKDDAKNQQPGRNYLVYIESTKSNIALNKIWINGVIHNGTLKEVSTPVLSTESGAGGPLTTSRPPLEMVPATKRKVYQVVFTALQPGQENAVRPPKHANKPVVIELQYRKKRKFVTVDEIREARPANMM